MDDNSIIQQTVNEMAELICNHYGYDLPVVVFNNRLTHVWGRCFRTKGKIELSTKFCLANDDDVVYGLLKHEIIHLKVGGHGQDFADECAKMGIACHTRFDHPEAIQTGKYTYMCIKCGRLVGFQRKLKRTHSCATCSPGVYDESCKLVDVTV